jgi:hypothetical protein
VAPVSPSFLPNLATSSDFCSDVMAVICGEAG